MRRHRVVSTFSSHPSFLFQFPFNRLFIAGRADFPPFEVRGFPGGFAIDQRTFYDCKITLGLRCSLRHY